MWSAKERTRIFQELIATIMICSSVHQSQLRSRAGTVSNGRGNEFLKDPRMTRRQLQTILPLRCNSSPLR